MSKRRKNTNRTGIIAIAVLLVLGGYYYAGEKELFADHKHYYGYYKDVAGLTVGTPVVIKGVSTGKIEDIELVHRDGIKVSFAIDNDVKLPKGSVAWLVPGGFNGGQGVRIDLGTGSDVIASGATLETNRDTGLIDNLNYKSGFYIRSGREILKAFDTSVRKFNYILNTHLLADIMNGVFYLDKNTGKYMAKSGELAGYSFEIDNGLMKINNTLADLAAKNDSINRTINKADTTMAGLSKKQFKESLDTLRDNIKSISASIHKLNTNKHLNDKKAYVNANSAADSANGKMKDIKEHPKAHWMAIFGKNKKK